jgi:hypothetical protein
MTKVKVELTIEKSDWLEANALLRAIQDKLQWRLATGGCRIIDAKISEEKDGTQAGMPGTVCQA